MLRPAPRRPTFPKDLPLVITGIGKTAAAVSTTRALAAEADVNGLMVVNIGTAGALRDGLAGIYEPGVVLNHEVNPVLGQITGLLHFALARTQDMLAVALDGPARGIAHALGPNINAPLTDKAVARNAHEAAQKANLGGGNRVFTFVIWS